MTADTDLRLARYFGVSDGFFLGLQADHDLLRQRRKIAAALERIEPPHACRLTSTLTNFLYQSTYKRRQAALPEAVPAADGNQGMKENVSENGTNSHGVAFETWLSAQFQGRGSERPDGSRLHEVVRAAMAESRSPGRDLPANGR